MEDIIKVGSIRKQAKLERKLIETSTLDIIIHLIVKHKFELVSFYAVVSTGIGVFLLFNK